MGWDADIVAELMRIMALLALILFCGAFVMEGSSTRLDAKRQAWWPFIIANGIYLAFVVAYYVALGRLPGLGWMTPFLAWALVSYAWVIVTITSRWGRGRRLVVPVYITWYLWGVFAVSVGVHLIRDTSMTAIDAIMLGLLAIAAAARIVLMVKAR